MIIKTNQDKEKAKALLGMAEITLKRLQETEIEKYPSNSLTDYYDILHKLMDAISALDGIKIKGEGAHFELINYVCKTYNLTESTNKFFQDMREYRNRISYEGFTIKENYITQNKNKIEEIEIPEISFEFND